MTGQERAGERLGGPRRIDAVLRDTVALLELVRREAEVLARLRGCVVELEAIRRARSTLADRTDTEVVEAEERLGAPTTDARCGRWGR